MNITKKLFPILLVLLQATYCYAANKPHAPKNSPVAINGTLQVVGTQLSNQQGSPLVLRGASLGWHNLWPRFYNQGAVAWLAKDWKCNVM